MNESFLQATLASLAQGRLLCEKALSQIDNDTDFFYTPGPRSQSIAATVKHVGGNLISRWTDFLTSDGEKDNRDRDNEFVILPGEDRASIMHLWARGWSCFQDTLKNLSDEDIQRTVYIRSEPHSVPLAIQRSVSHTSYHVGQIVYLCRFVKKGDWQWLTIPPGGTAEFNAKKMGDKKTEPDK
ncbi:MAG TPA: hypothetical protein DEA96_15825 [Leptospiraceae bacterium]|nr:hypothetical protein [Spirochaetaceae bacterium]HBS06437.1 hypothetical protein [Leptospiraceae bacterium]|tara:strand:+ start:14604 stop:15152 length:549 start_codon:yes stop_codon:yes gene_type:complete